jgi:hypothetical protein
MKLHYEEEEHGTLAFMGQENCTQELGQKMSKKTTWETNIKTDLKRYKMQ